MRAEYDNRDDGVCQVSAHLAWMTELYRSGQHRLDLSNASLAELLAFCVAVEMERGDKVSGSAGWDQGLPVANTTDRDNSNRLFAHRARRGVPRVPVSAAGAPEFAAGVIFGGLRGAT